MSDVLSREAVAVDGVWSPRRRRLTTGLVLTVTLVAFEALAIATVMPVVSDDLGGLGLYGWVFSGFFLASLLGTVVAGQVADRRGTRLPFAAGLVLFSLGLVGGGVAPTMAVLVAARVAQGVGAGVIPAVAYTTVGRRYPPALRPRVFAVLSTAWVVPGLLGPAAASAIEGWASWRLVFLALLPLVALAAAITLPALAGPRPTSDAAPGRPEPAPAASASPDNRRRDALVLVAGVALLLVGFRAERPLLVGALVAVGLPVAAWALVRLVPPGTLGLRPGMPAAVAVRGILTFAFFGADAFVSLAVTDARDQPTWLAGAALTACTLAWTAASWVQERLVASVGPQWLVRRGMIGVAAGIAVMIVAVGSAPVVVAVVAWTVAGAGIGLAYAPISLVVLGSAAPGEEGRASSAVQLTDMLGVALGTGVAGVVVGVGDDRGWDTGSSLTIAFAITLVVALAGAVAASRLPPRLPGAAEEGVPSAEAESEAPALAASGG